MKAKLTTCVLAVLFFSAPLFAQIVSVDSLQALKTQKEAIKISKEINEKKIKLAQKQKELQEKQTEMQQSAEKAQASADANAIVAGELTANPDDKKLSRKATTAANDAQGAAKNARKATESFDELHKDFADLQKDIQQKEQELALMGGVATSAAPATAPAPINSTNVPAGTINQENRTGYMANTAKGETALGLAQSVLASTYRNYPQQQGQPAIIINNIIVPSDYNQKQADQAESMQQYASGQDQQDYEDYKAWLRYKRGERTQISATPYPASSSGSDHGNGKTMTNDGKLTFRERFSEKPERNSGMWVIPMVGIHASNFKADFKDDQYQGRSGWNAGLDFRFRMRKFFIQPGVHYFSSSIDVTREDSISAAPLLSGPRIHSLKTPLMLGVYLTKAKGGFFRFNVKGGIVGNYVLNVDRNDIERFDKGNIEDFSYGLNAGIGLEFGFVTLDLSHEWGMSPLFKDSNQKNNVLRATLGFKL